MLCYMLLSDSIVRYIVSWEFQELDMRSQVTSEHGHLYSPLSKNNVELCIGWLS